MKWGFEFAESAAKEFRNLDGATQRVIAGYLDRRLADIDNPKSFGKALSGNLAGYWRYRIADYRVICEFYEPRRMIKILAVGHRRDIYD